VAEDREITAHLDGDELERAFDPDHYLGASSSLIDRALTRYRASPASRGER
jgi:adenylosuccinate lyase